jgi:ribosomal protein S6--L-glutamate ligase
MKTSARVGVVGIPGGWSSARLVDAFQRKTGFGLLIDMAEVVADLETGDIRFREHKLADLDALVIKKIGSPYSPDLLDRLAMLRYVKGRGLPIFSDPFKIKRVIDRLSGTITLRLADIPMPPTVVTEDIEEATAAVTRFEKAVLKPLYTSKARGMKIAEAGALAKQTVQAFHDAGNEVLYVQKMLDLPGRDLGLAFLGGKFLGCYARRGSDHSWNTTTRSGGKYESCEPSQEILDLAYRAQAPFGLDFTCVDIAESEIGPVVFEVSAFGGFRGLLEANKIDAAELYADFVLERCQNG